VHHLFHLLLLHLHLLLLAQPLLLPLLLPLLVLASAPRAAASTRIQRRAARRR